VKKAFLTSEYISNLVHNLLLEAGIISERLGVLNNEPMHKRYVVRAHSIRKFFRSQLSLLGVERDFIEYMMGHKTGAYHDIRMDGIEFLRSVYLKSGFSIRPQSRDDKILALRAIGRSSGVTLEEAGFQKLGALQKEGYVDSSLAPLKRAR
jgi:hypothetical protein